MWNHLNGFRWLAGFLFWCGLGGGIWLTTPKIVDAQHCLTVEGYACTSTPGPSSEPTFEPLFQTSTAVPTVDLSCPVKDYPDGWGLYTPDPSWMQSCSHCYATSTPTAAWPTIVSTPTPLSCGNGPCPTATPGPSVTVTVTPGGNIGDPVSTTSTPVPDHFYKFPLYSRVNVVGHDDQTAIHHPNNSCGADTEAGIYFIGSLVLGDYPSTRKWFENYQGGYTGNYRGVPNNGNLEYSFVTWSSDFPSDIRNGMTLFPYDEAMNHASNLDFSYYWSASNGWVEGDMSIPYSMDFGMLCYGQGYDPTSATPTPTPNPTDLPAYCGAVVPVQPIDTVFPIPRVSPKYCDIYISGWTWDTSFMASLGAAWFPASVTWANISVCYREIDFQVLRLFGVDIDLNMMSAIAIYLTLLRMLLRMG